MSSDEQEPTRRPRLIRTRRGRLLGGVCSGLGAHFDVDPILFRIAFVGLAIFSGVGIALYLAILLLTPEEGASRAPIRLRRAAWRSAFGFVVMIVAVGIALHAASHAGLGGAWRCGVGLGWLVLVGGVAALIWLRLRRPANRWNASGDRRLLGLLALGTALVVEATLLAVAGAWLAGVDELLAAWVVVALGAVLVVASFTDWARRLILPAGAFALAVAVIAAAHVDLHGGMGERAYRPRTLSEVRDGYRLGAGRLEVDLRGIAFPPGSTKLHVRLGIGELVVLVPHGVCVETGARVGGGYVGALEDRDGGLDVDWSQRPSAPTNTPRLMVAGRIGLGALLVANHPVERAWNGWGGWDSGFGSHVHRADLGTNEACNATVASR
jgi:phage shock protein PspC (stress-responsive transcriptional regulator)